MEMEVKQKNRTFLLELRYMKTEWSRNRVRYYCFQSLMLESEELLESCILKRMENSQS